MADAGLAITVVKDLGDGRGKSFPVPGDCFGDGFSVRDAHLSTLLPAHVRGDHYHVTRNEILLVMASDRWSLHWDSGEGTPAESRAFDGSDAVLIRVPPYASHAIKNDGSVPLQIIGLADGPYDPTEPDAFPRRVTHGGE